MIIQEHNIETGEVIEREATAEEIAQAEANAANAEAIDSANTEKAAAKAALLERLGITEEETSLLLA